MTGLVRDVVYEVRRHAAKTLFIGLLAWAAYGYRHELSDIVNPGRPVVSIKETGGPVNSRPYADGIVYRSIDIKPAEPGRRLRSVSFYREGKELWHWRMDGDRFSYSAAAAYKGGDSPGCSFMIVATDEEGNQRTRTWRSRPWCGEDAGARVDYVDVPHKQRVVWRLGQDDDMRTDSREGGVDGR